MPPRSKYGTCEKPARSRQSKQSHQEQAEHNDQSNGVAREKTCTVVPERNDLGWIKVGIARGGLPPNVRRRTH
jgi:hypothetical protein